MGSAGCGGTWKIPRSPWGDASVSHAATARLRLRLVTPEEVVALRRGEPGSTGCWPRAGVAGTPAFDGVDAPRGPADYSGRSRRSDPDVVNPIPGEGRAAQLLAAGARPEGDCLRVRAGRPRIDAGSNSVRLRSCEWQAEEKNPGARPPRAGPTAIWQTTAAAAGVARQAAQGCRAGRSAPGGGRWKDVGRPRPFAEKRQSSARELPSGSDGGGARRGRRRRVSGSRLGRRGSSVPLLAAEREAELAFLGVLRGPLAAGKGHSSWRWSTSAGCSTEIVIGDASGENPSGGQASL